MSAFGETKTEKLLKKCPEVSEAKTMYLSCACGVTVHRILSTGCHIAHLVHKVVLIVGWSLDVLIALVKCSPI